MAIMLSYSDRGLPVESEYNKTGPNALLFRPATFDFQREHTCHLTTLISVTVKIKFVKTLTAKTIGAYRCVWYYFPTY
jgi:hypothetical protein